MIVPPAGAAAAVASATDEASCPSRHQDVRMTRTEAIEAWEGMRDWQDTVLQHRYLQKPAFILWMIYMLLLYMRNKSSSLTREKGPPWQRAGESIAGFPSPAGQLALYSQRT